MSFLGIGFMGDSKTLAQHKPQPKLSPQARLFLGFSPRPFSTPAMFISLLELTGLIELHDWIVITLNFDAGFSTWIYDYSRVQIFLSRVLICHPVTLFLGVLFPSFPLHSARHLHSPSQLAPRCLHTHTHLGTHFCAHSPGTPTHPDPYTWRGC